MQETGHLPSRFLTYVLPSEGVIQITDQTTGKTGNIPVSSYGAVTSLFKDLFDSELKEQKDLPEAPEVTEQEELVASAPEKKKPGRPKKAAPASEPVEAKQEPVVKKKPGRPKKEAASTETPEVTAAPAEKKKPGRPKKVAAEATETKAATPKKPGRPKKTASEPVSAPKAAPASKTPEAAAPAASLDPSRFAGHKEKISKEGFEIILDKQQEGVVYDIIPDDGKSIGIVELKDNGKEWMVLPGPNQSFTKSKHTSLIGAVVRIKMLIAN